ncbi:MAG: hypothetical protein U1E76_04845 [Planctomycetota bacterium]
MTLYGQLDPQKIMDTIARLRARIVERFPDADLAKVAEELLHIAQQNAMRLERIQRPIVTLRVAAALAILVMPAALLLVRWSQIDLQVHAISDFVQMVDAGISTLAFALAIVVFVVTLEIRVKRQRALRALHELRALAHIVDMHQLTKDPESFAVDLPRTLSSPERRLGHIALGRYLDYCSEMLSLTSKIAALYAQRLTDPVVLSAVDQIEDLANRMSSKIWQKITILEGIIARQG